MAGIMDVIQSLLGRRPPTPQSLLPTPTDENMAAAVAEAKKRYPRFADLPLALTYNPKRDWNSETYPPEEEGNPKPGMWDVDMGRAPYTQKPNTWPELVGLEALHGLEGGVTKDGDPTYQGLVNTLVQSYTPEQMRNAKSLFNRYTSQGDIPGKPGQFNSPEFQNYLRRVDAQETIRGRLWGKLFHDTEHPNADVGVNNPWEGYTPKQINLLDSIQAYLQSFK